MYIFTKLKEKIKNIDILSSPSKTNLIEVKTFFFNHQMQKQYLFEKKAYVTLLIIKIHFFKT